MTRVDFRPSFWSAGGLPALGGLAVCCLASCSGARTDRAGLVNGAAGVLGPQLPPAGVLAHPRGGYAMGWAAGAGRRLPAGQTWAPGAGATKEQLEPGPGEITVAKAVEAARAFFPKIGMSVPAEAPSAQRFTPKGKKSGGDVWLVYGSEADLVLDARTGRVVGLNNRGRSGDHRRGALPHGPLRLSNTLSAQAYALNVMEGIGLPKDRKLADLQLVGFPGSPNGPGVRFPRVDAVFQPMPFGYRIDAGFGRYDLSLDALDGAVIGYLERPSAEAPYTIESHAATLKVADAEAKAKVVAKKYPVGRGFSDEATVPVTKPAQLMFVCPNGCYDGLKYDRFANPARLRLAWVFFYVHDEEVWIDAGDGRVLGGLCHAPAGGGPSQPL